MDSWAEKFNSIFYVRIIEQWSNNFLFNGLIKWMGEIVCNDASFFTRNIDIRETSWSGDLHMDILCFSFIYLVNNEFLNVKQT